MGAGSSVSHVEQLGERGAARRPALAAAERAVLARVDDAAHVLFLERASAPLTSVPRMSWISTHGGAVLRFTPPPPTSG